MRLPGKKILLGVTGSIAAYKAAEITRLFRKEGADVQVVMTKSAHDFITPITLSTLSGNPVLTAFSDPVSGSWNNHVELGIWADAILIAPCSANTLSKFAHGYCDDLLSAVYLSARCPVFVAPAMDLDMFAHKTTSDNILKLISFGNVIIGPESGELASGLSGEGRLTEPHDICDHLIKALSVSPKIKDKKILISAGPTREAIDPVRFISNHSSGKMGVALANELALRGAKVILVSGPGVKLPANKNITNIPVVSAAEMHRQCSDLFSDMDITIMAAAVADYTPMETAHQKIKKKDNGLSIQLKPTVDILAEMGKHKKANQLLVGFALETENEIENAKSKVKLKNLDFIVLNSLNEPGAGFNSDTNKITIIGKNNEVKSYDLKSKKHVASDIVEMIILYSSQ